MTDIDKLIAYEAGELGEDETIAFFQDLVDSGIAWSLQGHYGRTAQALIEAGLVSERKRFEVIATDDVGDQRDLKADTYLDAREIAEDIHQDHPDVKVELIDHVRGSRHAWAFDGTRGRLIG